MEKTLGFSFTRMPFLYNNTGIMGDSYILSGGVVVLSGGLLKDGLVVVRDGIISYVGADRLSRRLALNPRDKSLPVVDCAGSFILPRLTEMHIHGAFGVGFESLRGSEDILEVALRLKERGIGCFVPTILWDEGAVGRLVSAIEASCLPRSVIPGIYIEGPFVNPEKRGGIGREQIMKPDFDLCEKILETTRGLLKIMTLAPELPGIESLYPLLRKNGVLISLGHSAAKAGTSLPPPPFSTTHLYNGMSGADHRGGGLANIALAGFSRWVELNADGIHVNATAMKIASLCLDPERLILTSDAVVAAGLEPGEYSYFGKRIVSDGKGVRYRDEGTLVGSNKLGIDIVKSFAASTGRPLNAAVASMSATPSAALGMAATGQSGSVEVGAVAGLFIWDGGLVACRAAGEAASAAEVGSPEPDSSVKGPSL